MLSQKAHQSQVDQIQQMQLINCSQQALSSQIDDTQNKDDEDYLEEDLLKKNGKQVRFNLEDQTGSQEIENQIVCPDDVRAS